MEYREVYCGSRNKKQVLKNAPPRLKAAPSLGKPVQGPDGEARKNRVPEQSGSTHPGSFRGKDPFGPLRYHAVDGHLGLAV